MCTVVSQLDVRSYNDVLINLSTQVGPGLWPPLPLLFYKHHSTSNILVPLSTLQQLISKCSVCSTLHMYQSALNHGFSEDPYIVFWGLLLVLLPHPQDLTGSAISISDICFLNSTGPLCSAQTPDLCSMVRKLTPGKERGSHAAHFMCFSSLKDHDLTLLVSQGLNSAVSYILSSLSQNCFGLVQYRSPHHGQKQFKSHFLISTLPKITFSHWAETQAPWHFI